MGFERFFQIVDHYDVNFLIEVDVKGGTSFILAYESYIDHTTLQKDLTKIGEKSWVEK